MRHWRQFFALHPHSRKFLLATVMYVSVSLGSLTAAFPLASKIERCGYRLRSFSSHEFYQWWIMSSVGVSRLLRGRLVLPRVHFEMGISKRIRRCYAGAAQKMVSARVSTTLHRVGRRVGGHEQWHGRDALFPPEVRCCRSLSIINMWAIVGNLRKLPDWIVHPYRGMTPTTAITLSQSSSRHFNRKHAHSSLVAGRKNKHTTEVHCVENVNLCAVVSHHFLRHFQ